MSEVLGAVIMVAALLALIALMPPFDGRRDPDWGRQEGDEDGDE